MSRIADRPPSGNGADARPEQRTDYRAQKPGNSNASATPTSLGHLADVVAVVEGHAAPQKSSIARTCCAIDSFERLDALGIVQAPRFPLRQGSSPRADSLLMGSCAEVWSVTASG